MPNYTVTNNIDTLLRSTSNAAARTNLGLGDAATKNTGTTTGTVAAGDDSRLSNARTPTAHAASHAAAGSDPITITASQISGSLTQNTTGTAANVTGTVAIANGGTGQTTQQAAANALLPSQSSNNGKFLTTDGTNTSWAKTLAFAQTKTVGVDATTIQGCIDLVSGATASNQTQILIPPGAYTENLTLKPCVSLASTGGNNGQGSVVRVNGVHTATGAATAGDSILEINGIRFENTTTSPTITFNANGTTQFLVILEDCMVGNSNASTAVSGVVINANVVVRAVNVRSLANSSAGQGGTHWDLNGGSLYANGCSTEYGTCALLMRGTNGANYPYAELKGSYLKANGANTVSITSTTALLTAGWCSFENQAATANGINIAAGSVVGVYNSAFVITAGASNYVVNGAAGSLYFSTGNSYSNSSLIAYETKIGASVAQYAYTSTNVSKSGDTMTGKLTLGAGATIAPVNLGAATAPVSPAGGDIWQTSANVLTYRGYNGATYPIASTAAIANFTAGVGAAIGSGSTPALVVAQNGANAAMTVSNVSTSTSDCVTITNLGTGNSLVVNDDTTPDSTRFAVANNGRVGIGVTPDASVALAVDSTGIKFGDGTVQTTASGGGVAGVSSFSAGTTGLTPAVGTTGAVTLAGTLAIANGGTGQTTRQAAMDALAGATTSGQYLRGNGTDVVMSAIEAADVPTLNQNTTGTAANVTGTVLEANGGTGETTYANGQLLIGNAAGGLTKATLTAGSNVTITNGDGAITIASTGGGGGATTQMDVYTTTQTITIPAGAKMLYAWACGGGGGGGSGTFSDGVNAPGGGGASGGSVNSAWVSVANLVALGWSSLSVIVGAGGAGGAASTTASSTANGNSGNLGFASGLTKAGFSIGGSDPGLVGTGNNATSGGRPNSISAGGSAGSSSTSLFPTYGTGGGTGGTSASVGSNGIAQTNGFFGSTGGGGGGGFAAAGATVTSGGGGGGAYLNGAMKGGTNGVDGVRVAQGFSSGIYFQPGCGGGGGSGGNKDGYQDGGDGGFPGGGGGGGGGAGINPTSGTSTATRSGKGGNGANGQVILTWYF